MRRRSLLTAMGASLAAPRLAAPRLAAAQNAPGRRVLRFVPQADLALLDPVRTVAYVTRNHACWSTTRCTAWTTRCSRSRRWSRATSSRMTAGAAP